MATLPQTHKQTVALRAGIIYASFDGGANFDNSTLLPFDAGTAPANVVVTDGRIWKAVPGITEKLSLVSAPVDADLLDPASWTVAQGSSNAEGEGTIHLEGVTVLARNGSVIHVAPAELPGSGDGGVALIYSNGPNATTFNSRVGAGGGYTELVQHGKFSMVFDAESDRYWSITNTAEARPRHILGLYSSYDFSAWRYHGEVIRGPSSHFNGFQYPDFIVHGDDIVLVSRTAWEDSEGQPPRWHDGNIMSFHRVKDFRSTGSVAA